MLKQSCEQSCEVRSRGYLENLERFSRGIMEWRLVSRKSRINEHETSRILRQRWQIGGMVNNTKLLERSMYPVIDKRFNKTSRIERPRTMDRVVYSTCARRKFVETVTSFQRSNDVLVIHRFERIVYSSINFVHRTIKEKLNFLLFIINTSVTANNTRNCWK